ncbi:hypothetical protein [Bradyrhizobium sp. SZCCHNR1075]|uniref:hypothetical protein n=1 Tax=Bradyrhizobium sp. SZCCHNR1075 TaxID=3057362 RepID=UPI0028E1A6B2|nr:hypothetical protein [Bradyrhizobium sp. SZCCHNR1075]
MNLANNREARERADAAEARAAEANRNANQQRAWEALTQQGIQMMQGRPTVSCTTTGTSMMRTTNCY